MVGSSFLLEVGPRPYTGSSLSPGGFLLFLVLLLRPLGTGLWLARTEAWNKDPGLNGQTGR